jgi:hypothetical protein
VFSPPSAEPPEHHASLSRQVSREQFMARRARSSAATPGSLVSASVSTTPPPAASGGSANVNLAVVPN